MKETTSLAIINLSATRAVLRDSTDSRDCAIWLRRLTAAGTAGLLLNVAYFLVNGLLGLWLGDGSLRVAMFVNLALALPSVLVCLVGSEFNDIFTAEINESQFTVSNGQVLRPTTLPTTPTGIRSASIP